MKIKKSVFAAVLTLAVAMSLSVGLIVGANAVNDKKQIVAYEDYTIAIKLDGEVQTPVNASGARVYPITYNGTTYLPIRAVAGMAGLQVDWDQATQTVLLASKPANGVDLIDTLKAYDLSHAKQVQSTDYKTMDISGKTYSHWVSLVSGFNRKSVASFNIEGKYDTLTFMCYSIEKDTTLEVLGDNGYVLAEIPLKGGQLAQTVEVKLLGTSQLTFQIDAKKMGDGGDYREIYIMDARLS